MIILPRSMPNEAASQLASLARFFLVKGSRPLAGPFTKILGGRAPAFLTPKQQGQNPGIPSSPNSEGRAPAIPGEILFDRSKYVALSIFLDIPYNFVKYLSSTAEITCYFCFSKDLRETKMEQKSRFLCLFITSFVAFFMLFGCSGGGSSSSGGGTPLPLDPQEPKAEEEIQIAEHVTTLDAPEILAALDASSVENDDQTLIFDGQDPDVTAGSVIVMDVTDKTPRGLLRKVIRVRKEDGKTTLDTEPAALTEIVETGSLSVRGTASALLTSQAQPSSAGTPNAARAYIPRQRRCSAEGLQGSARPEATQGVGVEVTVLDFDYQLELRIRKFAVQHFHLSLQPKTNIALTAQAGSTSALTEQVLFACRLNPIRAQIGTVPVIITPTVKAILRAEAEATTALDIEFEADTDLTFGAEYRESSWTPIHTTLPNLLPNLPPGSTVAGTFATAVETSFVFYQTAGPTLTAEHQLAFSLEDEHTVLTRHATLILDMSATTPILPFDYRASIELDEERYILPSQDPTPNPPSQGPAPNLPNPAPTPNPPSQGPAPNLPNPAPTPNLRLALEPSGQLDLPEDLARQGAQIAVASIVGRGGTSEDAVPPTYRLRTSPPEAPFQIDPQTGVITLTADLNLAGRGYLLSVTATTSTTTTNTESLHVRVTDVNFVLAFDPSSPLLLFETTAVGTPVATVKGVGNHNVPLTFALSASDAPFAIDAQSGAISVSKALAIQTYLLEVEGLAFDESATGTLIVQVVAYQDGSEDAPFEVRTLEELQSIATGFRSRSLTEPITLAASLAAHYRLMADIDASPTASGSWHARTHDGGTPEDRRDDVSEHGFLPIGQCHAKSHCATATTSSADETIITPPFSGSFDGNGYSIRGLYIERAATNQVGLFGFVEDAGTLRHVTLQGGAISGRSNVGALVGYVKTGRVQNSFSSASVRGKNRVGGLIGKNEFSPVQNSFTRSTVRGIDQVGGLIGYHLGTVQHSFASGVVYGTSQVGGLVGFLIGLLETSFASSAVRGTNQVGGLVGYNSRGTVRHSFANGEVRGTDRVGGLIGNSTNGSAHQSFASGAVYGTQWVGTLIGTSFQDVVQDAYAVARRGAKPAGLFGSATQSKVKRSYCVGNAGDGCQAPSSATDVAEVSLETLTGLTCSSASFHWDDDGDDPEADGEKADDTTDATPKQPCSQANQADFPWDFGTASELPVLKGLLGGVLDAAAQRALIAFDARTLDDQSYLGALSTIDASVPPLNERGHTLEYHWNLPAALIDLVFSAEQNAITFTMIEGVYEIGITAFERDATGAIVRVYSDQLIIFPFQDGTTAAPYRVRNLEELQSIAIGFRNVALEMALNAPLSLKNSLAAHYLVVDNIDASPTASGSWQRSTHDSGTPQDRSDDVIEHGFLPIGNCGPDGDCLTSKDDNLPFSGSFDGRGYRIRGLFSDRQATNEVGLFGLVEATGVITNVALEGASIRGGALRTGALVGILREGVVQNSYAVASVAGGDVSGGLIGMNSRGSVQNSFAAGVVRGLDDTGGLIGLSEGFGASGLVEDNFVSAAVRGESYVGGLAGLSSGGILRRNLATADVSGGTEVGGLIGNNTSVLVYDSYASGAVSGNKDSGGLIGLAAGNPVRDSYAIGTVATGSRAGGLVGTHELSLIQRAYCLEAAGKNCIATSRGQILDVLALSLTALKQLRCHEDTLFRWDDDGDDPESDGLQADGTTAATAPLACSAEQQQAFPWDFGTDDELPALNGIIGGVLDAAAQRALIAFAGQERHVDVAATDAVSAPKIVKLAEGNTLTHLWHVVAGEVTLTASTVAQAELRFSGAADGDLLTVTILERGASTGDIVRVYAGVIALTVQ